MRAITIETSANQGLPGCVFLLKKGGFAGSFFNTMFDAASNISVLSNRAI